MTLFTLVAYLVLQLLVCIYISTRIKTEDDYLVGGRQFSLWIVAISLFATWFGAETCIGSSGAVYAQGLSGGRADPFGYSLCLFLSGTLIAGRLWNRRYVTLSDFYRERFGVKVEQLAVWVLSLSSLIWGAAQLRAFGQVISATSTLEYDKALFIGFAFVMAYTLLGGLIGDMITDVIQAIVIAIGLGLLLFQIFQNTPDVYTKIQTIPLERLSFLAEGEGWLTRADRWAIPILGSLVAQEIASRIFAAQSKKTAVAACYIGGLVYLLFGLIPVLLGLIGPQLIQVDGHHEQFLIQLAKQNLSPIMLGIFSGALISALLATIDTILLSVGGLISHNFLIPRLKIHGDRPKLLLSRFVVFSAGVVAYLLAVYSTGIYELLEVASSFGTAGILVITLFGLWFHFGRGLAGMSALVTGIVTTPVAEYLFESESPFLVAIVVSVFVYILASILEKKLTLDLART